MAEKRQHQRINCVEKCLLYHADSRYCGAITNISISGALIKLSDFTPGVITPGDTCSFILSNEPETYFCSYKGRITRVNATGVGLVILEHEF
ncbi:MAG: PilZ domain-containing protein [Proteobacteria bacterium]|nr:PilZ domain-containing protein [Pseudomonadota bacterium]